MLIVQLLTYYKGCKHLFPFASVAFVWSLFIIFPFSKIELSNPLAPENFSNHSSSYRNPLSYRFIESVLFTKVLHETLHTLNLCHHEKNIIISRSLSRAPSLVLLLLCLFSDTFYQYAFMKEHWKHGREKVSWYKDHVDRAQIKC